MNKSKINLIIIIICCVLIAACIGFVIWKVSSSPKADPTATQTSKPEFTPTAKFDPDVTFDFLNEDLSKYIKIGEYKGVSVETTAKKLTDEEIEKSFNSLISSYSKVTEITDRAIEYGDIVKADIDITADGETVAGMSDTDVLFAIDKEGKNKYAENIRGQLPGSTVTVDITEDIKNSDNVSQVIADAEKIEYIIKLKSIHVETPPECTDEFVKENLGFDTYAEFREYFDKYVCINSAMSSDDKLYGNIMDVLFADCEVISTPTEFVDNLYNYYKYTYEYYAYTYGVDYDTFMRIQVNMTDDELKAFAEKITMQEIMLFAISKNEGFSASEDEIKQYTEDFAKNNNMTADKFIEEYGETYVKEAIIRDKFTDMILKETNIVFAEATATITQEK